MWDSSLLQQSVASRNTLSPFLQHLERMELARNSRNSASCDSTPDMSRMDDVADLWTDYSSMIFSPRSFVEVNHRDFFVRWLLTLFFNSKFRDYHRDVHDFLCPDEGWDVMRRTEDADEFSDRVGVEEREREKRERKMNVRSSNGREDVCGNSERERDSYAS